MLDMLEIFSLCIHLKESWHEYSWVVLIKWHEYSWVVLIKWHEKLSSFDKVTWI